MNTKNENQTSSINVRENLTETGPLDEPSWENEPMSEADMIEFERDMCIGLNMMLGESYDDAQISAKQWMEDARE